MREEIWGDGRAEATTCAEWRKAIKIVEISLTASLCLDNINQYMRSNWWGRFLTSISSCCWPTSLHRDRRSARSTFACRSAGLTDCTCARASRRTLLGGSWRQSGRDSRCWCRFQASRCATTHSSPDKEWSCTMIVQSSRRLSSSPTDVNITIIDKKTFN